MPVRQVIFASRFTPLRGGVESYTENLAAALAQRGDEVAVATMRLDGSARHEVRDDGVEVFRFPCRQLMDGRFSQPVHDGEFDRLMEMLDFAGADRVLVNNRFYPFSLDGLAFARRMGLRAVLLDHGSMHLTVGAQPFDLVIQRYEHMMTNRTKRYGPLYAGVSRKSVEWLRHFGIDTDVVLPNAIDAVSFRMSSSGRDFRRELGVPAHHLMVAFVGRLAPEKGPLSLVEAARLLEELPVSFVLAGEGPLRKKVERAGVPTVHLAGQVGRADLSALLQQADVFCLPTRSEGFCTSLLEASAWGVPAVIPDVGGVRELVPDSSCGEVCASARPAEIARGLLRFIEGWRGECKRAGDAACALVEREHGWEQTMQALDAAYARL